MDTKLSTKHKFMRMFVRILSICVILTLLFPVTGGVSAEGEEPGLRAFPDQDRADGMFWPVDAPVELTINGVSFGSQMPNDSGQVDFPLTDYDLKRGDFLTLSNGVTSVSHTARQLFVTEIDLDAQTVSGTVDGGPQTVHVWTGEAQKYVDTDEFGNWKADFSLDGNVLFLGACGNAEAWEGPGSTIIDWCLPPNPFIAVSLTQHWFWVNSFKPETLVTFYVYDALGDESPILEFSRNTDVSGNLDIAGWEHLWEPEPGDYIVATDGINTKDLVLEYVTLNKFDPVNNLISGTALLGSKVDIGVGNADGEQWLTVYAEQPTDDENIGAWTADFNTLEFDITADMWAGAHVNDEDGDVTAAHNSGPPEAPAWFTTFPEQEAVEGWDWPLGAVIQLSIDDPATKASLDYQQAETVTFTPWGSWQLWVWFDFAGKYNMKPGDIVTLTDGKTTRTHIVRNLAITKVNHEDESVKGAADAGAAVYVWPHATGQQQMVIANPRGRWNVDFTGTYDLKRGDGGRAEIRDEMGNATAVDWYIPNPRITASITEDWFYLLDFTPNKTLDFSIYESQGGKPIWKGTVTTDESGWGWVNADGRWNLEPGNYLVVKDGSNLKDLVIEGFTFDVFDLTNGRLMGTAPEPHGRTVWVGIGWQDQDSWTMDITTDGGTWTADFGQPVPGNYSWVAAQIFDADGDATELRPSQIYPTLFAWLEWDQVDAHGWREGESITLAINGDEHVLTQTAGNTKLVFDLRGIGHDLTIGDRITMSDGLITKELLIPELRITDYDLGADTVSGAYDPNLGFRTYVNGQPAVNVSFDGNLWTANYNDLGPLMWGDAVQRDADSDEVAATIRTPNPMFYAVPDENRIFAAEWSPGQVLYVYINGVEVAHQIVPNPGSPYGPEVMFELDGVYDFEAGDTIALTDTRFTKELMVHQLRVTHINPDTRTISGTADPGRMFIGVNGVDQQVDVGPEGLWEVMSPEYDPGEWGSVIQEDDDGDQTRDIFMIPFP